MKAKTWKNCFIIMDNTKNMFFTKGRRLKVFENLKIRPLPHLKEYIIFVGLGHDMCTC